MSDEMDCDVCAGTGKPVSGKPCICGGTGSNIDEKVGLRRRVHELEEEAKKKDLEVLKSIDDALLNLDGAWKVIEAVYTIEAIRRPVKEAQKHVLAAKDSLLEKKCKHQTVPTFDGLGVRLKCQLCNEWILE
jgi:hypothetical protein